MADQDRPSLLSSTVQVILCSITLTTIILYSGLWNNTYTFGDIQSISSDKFNEVAQYASQVQNRIQSNTLFPPVEEVIDNKSKSLDEDPSTIPVTSIETKPPYSGPMVSIVVVSDKSFLKKYEYQMNTQICFAKKNGYEHTVVNPNDYIECKKYQDFFFRKHCAVRVWLHSKPEGYTAVIVDGDVIAGVSDQSLQKWLNIDFDVLLYERDWNYEITAGIYMVRNTNYGKTF